MAKAGRRRGRVLSFEALLREKGAPPKPPAIDPLADVALFQYTGGTTGRPRAAMLTHANLAANVQQILRYVGGREPGKDRILGILPLFHVFAMTAVMNLAIAIGAMMILMPKIRGAGRGGHLRRKKPTILPGVPTLFAALSNSCDIERTRSPIARFLHLRRRGAPGRAARPLQAVLRLPGDRGLRPVRDLAGRPSTR